MGNHTAEECLEGMLTADMALYETILDTPGFAYWFNELALLAKGVGRQQPETPNQSRTRVGD